MKAPLFGRFYSFCKKERLVFEGYPFRVYIKVWKTIWINKL